MTGAWSFLVGNFAHTPEDQQVFSDALMEIRDTQQRRDAQLVWRIGQERRHVGDEVGADLLFAMAKLIHPEVER